jgi:hypothetical protein
MSAGWPSDDVDESIVSHDANDLADSPCCQASREKWLRERSVDIQLMPEGKELWAKYDLRPRALLRGPSD